MLETPIDEAPCRHDTAVHQIDQYGQIPIDIPNVLNGNMTDSELEHGAMK